MKQPTRKHPVWRVALPIAAALVLVFGAITAGNLIPTVVTDTLYSAPAPQPNAARKAAVGTPYAATESEASGANPTDYAALSSLGMVPSDNSIQLTDSQTGEAFGGGSASSGTDTQAAPSGTVTAAKVVRTVDLTIATTTFDADSDAITKLALSTGGYIANVSVNGEASDRMDRTAYYSLRIPSAQLDSFLAGLADVGRVTYRNETSTDMTTQYSDTSTRLKTQQDKMTRLQELMKQAIDVSDLLEIESEIADTQYEIDTLQSSLLTIDRDVDKSSVTLTLQEQSAGDTAKTVELSLWQRIAGGFTASIRATGTFLQNLLVFLVMILPALAVIALVAAIATPLLRARRRRRAATPVQLPETGEEGKPAETPVATPEAPPTPPEPPKA